MSLTLQSITFRLDENKVVPMPLNLRGKPVTTPEWKPDRSNPILFPLCFTGKADLRIRVCIESTEPGDFEIIAEPAIKDANIMGSVKSQVAHFAPGTLSQIVSPVLDAPILQDWSKHRVRAHEDEWIWRYRPAGSSAAFEGFGQTRHQVYTVLGLPNAPWGLTPESAPWVEGLALACDWALGAQSVLEAASRITTKLYSLGEGRAPKLVYDGLSSFAKGDEHFDFSDFLQTINRPSTLYGATVNCSATASIITTLVNILGGDLSEAKLGTNFRTRPVRLIGQMKVEEQEFDFHEVAWGGATGMGDPVWDACLSFPDLKSANPVLPLGMPFVAGADDYRRKLLQRPGDAGPKGPVNHGQNRKVSHSFVSRLAETEEPATEPPLNIQRHETNLFVFRFAPEDGDVDSFEMIGWRREVVQPGLTAYLSVWLKKNAAEDLRLQITTVPLASAASALQYLQDSRSHIALPLTQREVGDIAFAPKDDSFVLMTAGNLFLQVQNIGTAKEPVLDYARSLAATLYGQPLLSIPRIVPAGGADVEDFVGEFNAPPDQSLLVQSPVALLIADQKLRTVADSNSPVSGIIRDTSIGNTDPIM